MAQKSSAEKTRTISKKKKDKMIKILEQLRKKMGEIDELREKIDKEMPAPIEPEKARAMIEEIKVPPLELIEDSSKKRR
jgi:hypothetical protein